MGAAFAWIGQLVEWFARFVPRWILLDTRQAGVKFQTLRMRDLLHFKWDSASKPIVLPPGLHWYWPVVTMVRIWVTARQSMNLSSQVIQTKDGLTFIAGGVVIHRIVDPMELIAHTFNPDEAIRDISAGVLHTVISGMTIEELELRRAEGSLNSILKKELSKQLKPFGDKVLRFALTDFARAGLSHGVVKLVHSSSADANALGAVEVI